MIDLAWDPVEGGGPYEPGSLEGQPVRLTGTGQDLRWDRNGGPEGATVDLSREEAWCIAWQEESRQYIVETVNGVLAAVPEGGATVDALPSHEFAGFRAIWPGGPASRPVFAAQVAQALAEAGWCKVDMRLGPVARAEALEAAEVGREFKVLKTELEQIWLGEGNTCKVAALEDDTPGRVLSDALLRCDRQLTELALLLRPLMAETLGLDSWGRTAGLVRMPDLGHLPDIVREEDVQEGRVEEAINFARLRRVSMLYVIECAGGEVCFTPRAGGGAGLEEVELSVAPGQLLVFRHDLMGYSFRPQGNSLALQAWIVGPPLTVDFATFHGGAQTKDAFLGFTGPGRPKGPCAHVRALAARLPGETLGSRQYWALLAAGSEAQVEVPIERWDWAVYYAVEGSMDMLGKTNTKHAAFLLTEELTAFDHQFFKMSCEEAKVAAPEQRLVAEIGLAALAQAGLAPERLRGGAVGVYTGDCAGEFPNHCHAVNEYRSSGASNASTAARLGHILGLRGPACSFDTACSSSLTALGFAYGAVLAAAAAMTSGWAECLHAGASGSLVVGVRAMVGPDAFIGLGAGGFLGPDGRCLTFDGSANGFGRSEGCTAAFLTVGAPGDDKLGSLACLIGTCVNQDGRSASMTAPHGPSQQECIRHSMHMAGIMPDTVSMAECHGTGTSLGDPIEVGALRGVLNYPHRDIPLMLTSSKSNIGHGEAVAGLSGFVKCVLALLFAVAPANVHLHTLNPHLDLDGFPCQFEAEAVDAGRNSQHAGVSSFGFGGTNARAELWAACQVGPRAAAKPDLSQYEYIDAPCPRCRGPMCWLCGVAIAKGGSPGGRHRCSLMREDHEGYDHCSACYKGRYRCGTLAHETTRDGRRVFIIGTWSKWAVADEMKEEEPGVFACAVALGETLREQFQIVLDKDRQQMMYPVHREAQQGARICGPDAEGGAARHDKTWLIDGRHDGKSAGAVYRINFEWNDETGRHEYFVVGTFTGGTLRRMLVVDSDAGIHEVTLRFAANEEEFHFVRDGDHGQSIYPAEFQAEDEAVPVLGPDAACGGRNWLLRGAPGEAAQLRLQVEGGRVRSFVARRRGRAATSRTPALPRGRSTLAGSCI